MQLDTFELPTIQVDTVIAPPLVADDNDELLATKYKALSDSKKAIEAQLLELREEIVARLGDSQSLVTMGGSELISYKAVKGAMRFDAARFKADRPELYSHYHVRGPETRRLLVKIGGNDE